MYSKMVRYSYIPFDDQTRDKSRVFVFQDGQSNPLPCWIGPRMAEVVRTAALDLTGDIPAQIQCIVPKDRSEAPYLCPGALLRHRGVPCDIHITMR